MCIHDQHNLISIANPVKQLSVPVYEPVRCDFCCQVCTAAAKVDGISDEGTCGNFQGNPPVWLYCFYALFGHGP
jgi:hypothetical protein